MKIYQGRKMFESLTVAQKELDPSGRRICIHNDILVVSVRPVVLQTFPGTIEQLFELGLKLGGTPLDVWKQNKKKCEDMDAHKELAFAKTFQLMEQGFNAHSELLKGRITELLRELIKEGISNRQVDTMSSFEKVSDLLLSFVVSDGDGHMIPALHKFSNDIHDIITNYMGSYVVSCLLQSPNDLMVLIKNPHSPYYNSDWENVNEPHLKNIRIYKTLLLQPDLKTHHINLVDGIRKHFFDMNPLLLKEVHNRTKLPYEDIQPKEQKEWELEDFLRDISSDALSLLLSLYFASSNPLTLVHNTYFIASMTKDVLANSEEINKEEDIVLKEFAQKVEYDLPLFRELIEKLELNKSFLIEHILESDEDEDEDDYFFEDMDFDNLEYFREVMLENAELSWKAKALFAYAYIVEVGYCNIQSMVHVSKDRKQKVMAGLKELEEQDIGYFDDDDDFILHISPEFINASQEELFFDNCEEYRSILENENLSWKAKGIALFICITEITQKDHLENRATDSMRSVKEGIKELMDCGVIEQEPVNQMIDTVLNNKEHIKNWYNHSLRSDIQSWLTRADSAIHLLNAIYPSMGNLSALEMAVIADDDQMVESMLQLESIELPIRSINKLPITHTALICKSYSSMQVLLKDKRICDNKALMYMTLLEAIAGDVDDLSIIRKILMTEVDVNVTFHTVPSPLQVALEKKKIDLALIRLLLEFGASPDVEFWGPYDTIADFVEDKGNASLKKLFRNNKSA